MDEFRLPESELGALWDECQRLVRPPRGAEMEPTAQRGLRELGLRKQEALLLFQSISVEACEYHKSAENRNLGDGTLVHIFKPLVKLFQSDRLPTRLYLKLYISDENVVTFQSFKTAGDRDEL